MIFFNINNDLFEFFKQKGYVCCAAQLSIEYAIIMSTPVIQWLSYGTIYICICTVRGENMTHGDTSIPDCSFNFQLHIYIFTFSLSLYTEIKTNM